MSTYGDRIKQLRTEHNLSLKSLGEVLGVSDVSVHKWEHQKTQPDINCLLTMADYFHVTTDYILGRTDDPGRQQHGDTITLQSVENGHIKEAPLSQGSHEVSFEVNASDLPTNRKQLEQLVRGLLDQALADRSAQS